MLDYIRKAVEAKGNATLEAKVLSNRYTCSNVASWGIGVNARCFDNDPSDLYKLSFGIFQLSFLQNMGALILMIFPPLRSIIKVKYANPIRRISSII